MKFMFIVKNDILATSYKWAELVLGREAWWAEHLLSCSCWLPPLPPAAAWGRARTSEDILGTGGGALS